MKKLHLFGGLAILLVVSLILFAQVPGKHFSFTSDRFWANDGVLRTDSRLESFGTSNGLRLYYGDGIYTTLAEDSSGNLTLARAVSGGTLKIFSHQADALADDGTVSLPDATAGIALVSCNAESIWCVVAADGSVVKAGGSTNTAAADTDTALCIYDGGTYAIVKNRLGTTGKIRIVYLYN